jgi:hypothetical protein
VLPGEVHCLVEQWSSSGQAGAAWSNGACRWRLRQLCWAGERGGIGGEAARRRGGGEARKRRAEGERVEREEGEREEGERRRKRTKNNCDQR